MIQAIRMQIIVLSLLVLYPLVFSILTPKETLSFHKENLMFKITNAGLYTQWSVLENNELIHIITSIRLRVSIKNSIYIIFDRKGIIRGKLKHEIKYDKKIAELFGDFNPYVIVSYESDFAKTISFNGKTNYLSPSK